MWGTWMKQEVGESKKIHDYKGNIMTVLYLRQIHKYVSLLPNLDIKFDPYKPKTNISIFTTNVQQYGKPTLSLSVCITLPFTKLFPSLPLRHICRSHIYLLLGDQTFSFPQSARLHRKYIFNVLLFATLSVRCFFFIHIWNPLI